MVSTLSNDHIFIFRILLCNSIVLLEEKHAIGYLKYTGYAIKATELRNGSKSLT